MTLAEEIDFFTFALMLAIEISISQVLGKLEEKKHKKKLKRKI